MTRACSVPWCGIHPADGDATCAIHRDWPVSPGESAETWRTRVSRTQRTRRQRQHAIAQQDARDAAKRGAS